jgi:SMI1 / KNR4 family (SUKH-1)
MKLIVNSCIYLALIFFTFMLPHKGHCKNNNENQNKISLDNRVALKMNSDQQQRIINLKQYFQEIEKKIGHIKFGNTLSEEEIRIIEKRLNIRFPDEYRQILLQVFSGISSSDEQGIRTLQQSLDEAKATNREHLFSKPFPFTENDITNYLWQLRHRMEYRDKPPFFVNGNPDQAGVLALQSNKDGCVFLVLNGPLAGSIWQLKDKDSWIPHVMPINVVVDPLRHVKPEPQGAINYYQSIFYDYEEKAIFNKN